MTPNRIKGKITVPHDTLPDVWVTIIYQGAAPFALNATLPNGEKIQRRTHTPTGNATTPAAIQRRAHFAAAMAAWQALSPSEKLAWKTKARNLVQMGHNLFLSNYLLTVAPPAPTGNPFAPYSLTIPHHVWPPTGKIRAIPP